MKSYLSAVLLLALPVVACSSYESERVGRVEESLETNGGFFDMAPDDPRQYQPGNPGLPILSAQAYLQKYGCDWNSRAPRGYVPNPDDDGSGDLPATILGAAHLHKTEWDAEEEATVTSEEVVRTEVLACDSGTAESCSSATHVGKALARVTTRIADENSFCLDHKNFLRVSGGLRITVPHIGLNLGAEVGQEGVITSGDCFKKSHVLEVSCGGQTFAPNALGCNSYFEHAHVRLQKVKRRVEWPTYRSCELMTAAGPTGYVKTRTGTGFAEERRWEDTGDGFHQMCEGCRLPQGADYQNGPAPNCMTQNASGAWVASIGNDGEGHILTLGTPEGGGACVGRYVMGCMDPRAANYRPSANADDGSCAYVEDPPIEMLAE